MRGPLLLSYTVYKSDTYTNNYYKYMYLFLNTEPVPHQVYQSLDRELQKHVSNQDTLQQCETWLSTVQEEIQRHSETPFGLQEALKQVSERPDRLFTPDCTFLKCLTTPFSYTFFTYCCLQVKHLRALQEQASTYLDLVCSVCDLSDEAVRATATKIQQIKTMVSLVTYFKCFVTSSNQLL